MKRAAVAGGADQSRTWRGVLLQTMDRHARLLWWIGAGVPPLVAVTLLFVELLHPPDMANGYDLSEAVYHLSAGLTIVAGIVMAVATIRRLGHQLSRATQARNSAPSERLRAAREARFRAAWMLFLAASLIALGLVMFVLPEYALI